MFTFDDSAIAPRVSRWSIPTSLDAVADLCKELTEAGLTGSALVHEGARVTISLEARPFVTMEATEAKWFLSGVLAGLGLTKRD